MSNADFSQLPLCGDLDMRIARDGTWYYRGSPISRKPLVKLFSSVLRREDDGAYWLVTPAERGRVVVEDAPFTAIEVMASGTGREQILRLRTNIDEEVVVDAGHPIWMTEDPVSGAPAPYLRIRPAVPPATPASISRLRPVDAEPPFGLEALILRSVYYHLVELGDYHLIDGKTVFGIWSSGSFFPLGELPSDEVEAEVATTRGGETA
ncbi:MAG TPA: DUF1285 domain-containing protein [Terriglobales bacterium]|nr:DUF1285 domain-containing protein [Terriglobales bacterium]